MTCYICLDDRNGMLFNRRRQSRDAAVLEDIRLQLPCPLTIDPFSEKLIQEAQIPWVSAPEDLTLLPPDSHCFWEARPAQDIASIAHRLVIYRWNRHYPSDVRWNVDLSALGFTQESTTEFPGKSHERITKEVYTR